MHAVELSHLKFQERDAEIHSPELEHSVCFTCPVHYMPQSTLRNLRNSFKDHKAVTVFCHIERTLETEGFVLHFSNNTNLPRQSQKVACVLL